MDVYVSKMGSREFLVLFQDNRNFWSLPIDKIKEVDFSKPNGGCDNSVCITMDDGEEHFFAYHKADALRDFLASHRIT
jgi:hypothetical protein